MAELKMTESESKSSYEEQFTTATLTPTPKDQYPIGLSRAFDRTLSTLPSYDQMKRTNNLPDFHVKIVIVGDEGVGKTCLLISYVQREFPTGDIPTVFENYVTDFEGPDGEVVELALWDTAAQEDYNRLRPLSYTDVDILLVCYSVANPTSLKNIKRSWIPEVKHFCYKTPVILVGLKSDLYDSNENTDTLVDPKEAEQLAEKLGALAHLQCSAKTRQNVEDVFTVAIRTVLAGSLYAGKHSNTNSLLKKTLLRYSGKKKGPTPTGIKESSSTDTLDKDERTKNPKCILM
ncbi:hypothetical protein NCAS_0B08090 [Naumovozyma castellii]|uniref:GTP-binding protein RHO4 n=1 Tax=Naumovozyma castellii TaxID=27288 RepID=G0VAG3_NAUCA|nr:hypothetical protein NCAS_0B08090 [Naumovozyma castellii CBS 4309]CCC68893.1 hypothetical protein NCAS_0B08090 [Naumovozyma castellii CBS 4309]